MIEATDIAVELGGRPILRGVSVAAPAGEVTAIIGPNGSGKSTLLKALCGDLRYSGTISINERDLATMRPVEAAAMRAVLPQAAMLTFPFTVHEVVRLGLTHGLPGVSAAALRRLPGEALARVDLGGFGGRFYQDLSGGEQQRVHLARVLCQVWLPVLDGVPRFLLLDEPVSSLDIRHQLLIMGLARDYAERGGGVIAVLHDLNLAAMFADRVLAMRDGRVAAAGTPAEVLNNALIARVFDCDIRVGEVPTGITPFVLPQSARPEPVPGGRP